MRQRITFVHPPGAEVDPQALRISQHDLRGPTVTSTREDRLTIALDELPTDVAELLPRLRDLSLRWTSPLAHDTIEPFVSRISPGLHVSYTLVDDKDTEAARKVCDMVSVFGSGDCASNEAFTTQGEGQSANPPGASLHAHLEDLSPLTSWAAATLCRDDDADCQTLLGGPSGASTLDISWDNAADHNTLRIHAVYPLGTHPVHVRARHAARTEVGILSRDTPPNQKPHELGISGLLTVLGESRTPSVTMFSFPSRHRSSGASFSARFTPPAGLHPTLRLRVSPAEGPPLAAEDGHCAPYAYLTLPRALFADRYQLADPLLLASKNLSAVAYTTLPVDLEAPAYTTKTWGSSLLVELAPPSSPAGHGSSPWTAEVPLHLRYLEPSPDACTTADVEIPYPAVFWACESTTGADFANNPFDRRHVGYDALFSRSTVFWHVRPEPNPDTNRLMSALSVPVLDRRAAAWIGHGTAAAVALGFAWLLRKLVAGLSRAGYARCCQPAEAAEGKKRR